MPKCTKKIGRHDKDKQELLLEAKKFCDAAVELNCPVVQITAQNELDHLPQTQRMDILKRNISDIADIGKRLGLRFQIEVMAFTKFNTLKQAIQLINDIKKDNVGVVTDFWHLYAGGGTTPKDVAEMDKDLIYGVHFCDGRKLHEGEH